MKAELIVDAQADLGEGPLWDPQLKRLYWVDIEGGKIHVYQPGGEADRVLEVGCKVGVAALRDTASLVLGTENGFEQFDLETCERTLLADPESDKPSNRFNDGKCDARGRFWAGTMSMAGESKAGSLYVMESDHSVQHVLGSVTTSNGLDWSPDLSTMYYIDTPTMKVRAYHFDLDAGKISEERVVVEYPEGVGRPDGMTVDAEGMLWTAHWDGGRISRWDPATGKVLATVTVPADRVTCCTFGGEQLDVLFITTARHGLNEAQLAQQPHAGGLFAVQPGVSGMPANRFAG